MIANFFIHSKLLEPIMLKRLLSDYGTILDYRPAYTVGRLYKRKRMIYLVRPNYCLDFVYGTLYTIDIKDETVFKILDSYHGCTEYIYKNKINTDLSHREIVQATVISFNSSEEFIKAKYQNIETVECYAYIMNNIYTDRYKDLNRHKMYNFLSNFLTVFPKYSTS
jgi:hypothetical protein